MSACSKLAAPIIVVFLPGLKAQPSLIPPTSKRVGGSRTEPDTDPVDNPIRQIAPTKKNAPFASHEFGAKTGRWPI